MVIDRQALIEQSISELKDIAYNLKAAQMIQELEAKHLKQSVEEIKKIMEKEAEKREQEKKEAKTSATTVKTALITGMLGFITATVVALISFFKH